MTHRLAEVTELADRVVVLRDGEQVGMLPREEIEEDRIVSLMVGRDIQKYYHRTEHDLSDENALEVEDLRYPKGAEPVSLRIRRGEIVGFAGLIGAGRTELARALFGIDPVESGTIKVGGKTVPPGRPRRSISAGLSLVPEDRKAHGLFLPESLAGNVAMPSLGRLGTLGLLNRGGERELASRFVRSLSIRARSIRQRAMYLSGGNQQKVVLAKWLAMDPTLLVLDEPTRGVDVGAKSDIYALLFELAKKGVGILMISSEMEEIIAVSDRVIVMREGRIWGELMGDRITEENIMALAIGSEA